MFVRTLATSTLGIATRLGPVSRTATRMMIARPLSASAFATAAQPAKRGKVRQLWAQVPVDVYPLVFAVSGVCALGIFTLGWHLATDRHLRLMPDRMRTQSQSQ